MTDASFSELNSIIKKEADVLLFEKGLFDTLGFFGTPHVSGSYSLELMTWRDLDIYLEVENISVTHFFELGGRICSALIPSKMNFRNELLAKTKGLPSGLYWGIYLGNERAGAWKIDVWAVEPRECRRLIGYCDKVKNALTPETILMIMDIKSHCWKDPEYRKLYTSIDIYTAVLDYGVIDLGGFKNYLRNKQETEASH